MLEMFAGWFEFLLRVKSELGVTNAHIWGTVFGLVISWTLTQRLKRWAELSRRQCEIVAFFLAWISTFTISAGWPVHAFPVIEFWLAVTVGLSAPLLYKILMKIGKARGWCWVLSLQSEDDPTNEGQTGGRS